MLNILKQDIPPIPSSYSDDLINLIHRLLDKNSDSRPSIIELLMIPFVQSKMSIMKKKKAQLQQQPGFYSQSSTENNSRLITALSNDEEDFFCKEHDENNKSYNINIIPITNHNSNTFLNKNQMKSNYNNNLGSFFSNSSSQNINKSTALNRKSVDAKKARKIVNAYVFELQEGNSNNITPNVIFQNNLNGNLSKGKPRHKSISTTKPLNGSNIQLIDNYPKNSYTNNISYKHNINDSPHCENRKLSSNALKKNLKPTTTEILITMDSNSTDLKTKYNYFPNK